MTPDRFELEAEMDAPLTKPRKKRKKRKEPLPRGHAALPGTGPAGETCGSCKNLFRREYAKTYLKCGLMERLWTGGRGTDVRKKDLACKRWEKKNAG